MKLARSISQSELNSRLKLADLNALKDIVKSFKKVALINLNEDLAADKLKKVIESVYFRKRELMPEEALLEPIEGTYSFDSLISCPLTERQNKFEFYRYIYDHITPGEPIPREKFYEICKQFYTSKGQKFNKRHVYALVRNVKTQQEEMENKVIISESDYLILNRIYTWKDNYAIMRGENA